MSVALFLRNRSGATAIMFAVVLLPLLLAVGAAIDFGRQLRAGTHLQDIADAAAIAAATSESPDKAVLKRIADDFAQRNASSSQVENVLLTTFEVGEDDSVTVSLSGDIGSSLMALAGFDRLPVAATAVAVRGYPGSVEVALVLDNTWSMSDRDAKGVKKIDALKSAAETLVEELLQDDKAEIRVALVPYAEYVNVGKANRSQPWLSVPADTTSRRTCKTKTTRTECSGNTRTCTRTRDGVTETYRCGGSCRTVSVPPYQSCSGGAKSTWHGCVGSRTSGDLHLSDNQPSSPYPGLLSTSQRCMTPVMPLTSNRSALVAGIRSMVINIGGYKPATYIPAGMVWGINMLSPTQPFSEGADYDEENRRPRKTLVLMTDGENSMRLHPDGTHRFTTAPGQIKKTNADTIALCDHAKLRGIEVFSVAFAVPTTEARKVLETCASGTDHYFDAADSEALATAFAQITASLKEVRIAR